MIWKGLKIMMNILLMMLFSVCWEVKLIVIVKMLVLVSSELVIVCILGMVYIV